MSSRRIDRITRLGEVILAGGYLAGVVEKLKGRGWEAYPSHDTARPKHGLDSVRVFATRKQAAECCRDWCDGGKFR